MKKVFILLGHPNKDAFTGSCADAYEQGALDAGHEVRRQNIGEMKFDPILRKGYLEIQELEPDLITFQENVKWADHFVILYPNWWGTMPAILKGIFDRAWLPGFAFQFKKDAKGIRKYIWDCPLRGKTARIIILANTHPWVARTLFGDFTNELSRATLGFSGIKAKHSIFSPSEKASDATRERWHKKIRNMGKKAV